MLYLPPTSAVLLVHDCENNFFLPRILKTFEGHIALKPLLFQKLFNLPLIKADDHNVFAVVMDILDVL